MENNQNNDSRRQPRDSRRISLPIQYGRVPHCPICQSIYNWFKDCPHNVRGSNSKVTHFIKKVQKCYVQIFSRKLLIWQFWTVVAPRQYVDKIG